MSSLLERAIVDATALKEAALKNAENMVIEKYSQEVKDAVKNLLEQEEDLGLGDDTLGLADPDPMADPASAMGLGTGDDLGFGSPEEAETEETTDTEDTLGLGDTVISDIPDGWDPDLGDPDDEVVRIKLDSLRAEFEDEEKNGRFGGDDELGDDEIGIDIVGVDDVEDDEEVELDLSPEETAETEEDEEIGINITKDTISEVLQDMNLEDEDIDLDEIMERLRVDFEPQKSGWAGTPEPIMREYEAMLLAREQDTKVKEENEELRKAVAALQKENKILSSAASKLQAQKEQFMTTFETLQEKLETTNVSNAKLLYINRALENASLNERQKKKIVETISKAESIQEARMLFETLEDAVISQPAERKVGSLNEAVSKRSSLLIAAREEQKQPVANPVYNRLQKLAGIKT